MITGIDPKGLVPMDIEVVHWMDSNHMNCQRRRSTRLHNQTHLVTPGAARVDSEDATHAVNGVEGMFSFIKYVSSLVITEYLITVLTIFFYM